MTWTSEVFPLDVIELIRVLDSNGVRYVIVGGIAAMAHGYAGTTEDVDAVPALDPDNLERLASALRELDARCYADPRRRELVWHFSTRVGIVDVLAVIDGPGGYDALVRNASETTVAGVRVLVASLDDLIESKETTGRDKDLRALGELRRLRERPQS
ncbi:MAG: hypothetical protein U0V73_06610 [Acidimicrobiia bacterium]